jgi:predicted metalloprotease with PDZ domain
VRVRLTRIDPLDLNLFEFDYDLTFMVFFLNVEGRVYARYGGRDAETPDSRQSLAGLRYTMESVLQVHAQEQKAFAPRTHEGSRFIREAAGARRGGRCFHCHQVKEILNAELQRTGLWSRDRVWRYPLPENLGLELEVDRGNVVRRVREQSPAAAVGLQAGDQVRRLNGVPIHSFADAQFALDRAPARGSTEVVWERDRVERTGSLALPDGWRESDLTWRPSMQRFVANARLWGADLSTERKKALGLPAQQLAFRQNSPVPAQPRAAGIQAGDIILGVNDRALAMDVSAFNRYVSRHYLVGDQVVVNVLRDGKRLDLPMRLLR